MAELEAISVLEPRAVPFGDVQELMRERARLRHRAEAAEETLRRLEEQLEAERARVRFCPYCAGAVVDVIEGPCPGCQRAEAFERQRDELQEQLEVYERALREIADRRYEGGAKKWWAPSEVREVALNALLPTARRFQCQVGPGCENATPDGPCCGIPASFPASEPKEG